MVPLITILGGLAAVLLILIILFQNPKGGGLSSTFGGSQAANQLLGGAANSVDVLEKITWALVAIVFGCCLAVSLII